MRLDVYFHSSPNSEFATLLHEILEELKTMSALMDTAVQEAAETKDAVASVLIIVKDLRDKLIDAGTDQVKLAAIIASLNTDQQAIADAIVANTPADPNA